MISSQSSPATNGREFLPTGELLWCNSSNLIFMRESSYYFQRVFRKSRFRRVWFHIEISVNSGPKFTRFISPNQEESWSMTHLAHFQYLHPFQRYLPSKFKVDQNRAQFCMFLASKIFLRGPLEILDQDYKIEHTSKHHTKFCGDRSTELGDLRRKKENKC